MRNRLHNYTVAAAALFLLSSIAISQQIGGGGQAVTAGNVITACGATNTQILYDNAGSCAGETLVPAANGGTGVANTSTITLGGNVNTANTFATLGNFGLTVTTTATTNATLPAGTHTLAGLDVANNFSANQTFSTVEVGSSAAVTVATGEQAMSKITASGSAPGAGFLKFEVTTGTNAGSCKIIAYAGTSTTPVTIVDNVGTGC